MHTTELKDSRGRPVLVLNLIAPRSSSRGLPKYLAGESIAGQVALSLEQSEPVHSISLTLKGRVVSTYNEIGSCVFLQVTHELYRKQPTQSKLAGDHVWPFSFPFPTEVPIDGYGKCFLPQTFMERTTAVAVQYELVAHVNQGKLRAAKRVQTHVAYIPKTIADAPSPIRSCVYARGLPLPSPREDPRGWLTLEPAVVRGRLFEKRDVEVRFILSLASPLSYARGTVIPCHMTVQCFDEQALELLSKPKDLVVHLRRQITYVLSELSGSPTRPPPRPLIHDIAKAIWWPSSSGKHRHEYERRLDGEIHLGHELQPSSDFPHFRVKYGVVVIPAPPTGFKPEHKPPQVAQTVQIATWHAPGPLPRPTRPRQESAAPVDQTHIENNNDTLFDSLMTVFGSTRRRSTIL
ncbi:hypothetical protein BD626DRAFT_399770 [Schizophyllum amplum]|uniref:Uncharacterized protein n=1 Tax=Schizophyllum amplum TaxID=97359 RepID=A0A550CJZ9_9AGAR|nr:hypothetical protein BD626DRAFT_399770 [Auriculariopsis ampla]